MLDTPTLVWLDEGNHRLGKRARTHIDKALQDRALFVCTISFWEVCMLLQNGRLEMSLHLNTWRNNLIQNGLQELPLTSDAAILAGQLIDFHGDPADRIIAASTILSASRLCTADKKLLTYKKKLNCVDAGK